MSNLRNRLANINKKADDDIKFITQEMAKYLLELYDQTKDNDNNKKIFKELVMNELNIDLDNSDINSIAIRFQDLGKMQTKQFIQKFIHFLANFETSSLKEKIFQYFIKIFEKFYKP